MAIGGMISWKRKPIEPAKKEVFSVRPERALEEVVRRRFQSELFAVRRLLDKAAALPVPRSSEEPPTKRSKTASTTPVVVVGGVSPVAMAIAPPPLQLAEDEYVDICGDYAPPVAMPKNLADDAAISGSSDSDSDSGSDLDSDSDMSVDEAEEDVEVDICGGVSPMVIATAPLQLAEDEGEDICGDASPLATPKNLGDDRTISGSPSSSSSSDSDSDDSASDSDSSSGSSCSSSDSDSDSDESVDSPAPAERAATPPKTVLIARAMESQERQLREARSRAREKARQEVLETERAAMPDETVHWTVLKSLEIAQYNMAKPDNVLRELELFLKADHDHQDQQHRHHQSFEEDLEEGEIRS